MKDHLCAECAGHFSTVQQLLQSLNIPFTIDGRLVRGLDYYTKTAFEITSSDLGSQDALAGGGRYDLLVKELGGKPTPGTGFAAGVERLMMVVDKLGAGGNSTSRPRVFLIGLDAASRSWAFVKTCMLRKQGISAETDYLARSLKAQMREANRQQAEYVVIVGEQELQARSAKLKSMQSGHEVTISLDSLEQSLK
jgi:histidyl-tRNA synthetase